MQSYRIIPTPHGYLGYTASRPGVTHVVLPQPTPTAAREQLLRSAPGAIADDDLLPELAADFERYFAGTPLRAAHPLDFANATPFMQRIWDVCREIPFGQTTTYRALAARAGRPQAARAVGLAMARNRCPILVPCHRVLRSDGGLGGWSGPGGLGFKQRLLDLEHAAAAACAEHGQLVSA